MSLGKEYLEDHYYEYYNKETTFMAITIKDVRFSYCNLFQPQARPGQDPKYSVTILMSKTNTAAKALCDQAVAQAIENGVASKWKRRAAAAAGDLYTRRRRRSPFGRTTLRRRVQGLLGIYRVLQAAALRGRCTGAAHHRPDASLLRHVRQRKRKLFPVQLKRQKRDRLRLKRCAEGARRRTA